MPISPPQVSELVEKVVADNGFDLEEVVVRSRDGQDEVSIVVDRDGGGDLDVLARLSNTISDALDASPLFADLPYVLEVTSPGIDRPLTLPRHWRRNAGRKMTVDVTTPDGVRTVAGRVGRLGGDPDAGESVEIVVNHRGRIAVETVALADVARAVVGVDFGQPSRAELELCGLDDAEIDRRRAVR